MKQRFAAYEAFSFDLSKKPILGQRLINLSFSGRSSAWANLIKYLHTGGGAGRAMAGTATDLKGFHHIGTGRFLSSQ